MFILQVTQFIVICSSQQTKISQNLEYFLELIRSTVDICNLFHCFLFYCSEESNLNVGRYVNFTLFDRGLKFVFYWKLLCHTLCCSWQATGL